MTRAELRTALAHAKARAAKAKAEAEAEAAAQRELVAELKAMLAEARLPFWRRWRPG